MQSIKGVNAVSKRWRVIIVGGGFGGLRAAQALKSAPVEVTLIDRRNYHLFQPLLYQVATGSLSPGEIAAPLRSVLSRQKNTRVLLGEVVDLDPLAKRVMLADGASFAYDALIVAAGSQTFYYGHDAWRAWAPGMKSVEEATNIRHKILYAFEVAERVTDPVQRRAWLTFVIVGAGATGVELAGAIGEIARQTLKHDFRSIRPEEAEIILLDGAPRVLPPFPEDLAQKAARSLAQLGVEVKTGVSVEGTRLNRQHIDAMLGRSLMLVTALSPVIGYDKAAAIAHKAHDENLTLKEAALQSGDIDEQRFDEIVDAKKMVGHGVAGS